MKNIHLIKNKIFEQSAQTLVSVLLYLTIFGVIATIATIIVVNIIKQSSIQESQNKAATFAQERLKQIINSQKDIFNNQNIDSYAQVFSGVKFDSCALNDIATGKELKCNLNDNEQAQKIALTCDKSNAVTLLRLKINKDEALLLNPTNVVKLGFEDVDQVQLNLVYLATDTLSNKVQTKIFTTVVTPTKLSGSGNLNLSNSISETTFDDEKLQIANIKNKISIDSGQILQTILANNWNNSKAGGEQILQLVITPISSDGTFTIEDNSGSNLDKITCEAIATQTDSATGGNSTSAKYEATVLKYGTRLGILDYGLGIYKVQGITNQPANLVK